MGKSLAPLRPQSGTSRLTRTKGITRPLTPITEVVRLYGEDPGRADELALARIEHQREDASQRLAKTRDIGAWQATMLRLDAEAEVPKTPREDRRLAPAEVVAYVRSLPSMWPDSGPEGRQALATALFARVEVEGYRKMTYELTPDAIELGLNAALPAVLEVGTWQIGEFGRGERDSPFLTHLSRPRFVMVNRTPRESFPVAAVRSA